MRLGRRCGVWTGVAGLAVAGVVGVPGPAGAAGPPVINSLICEKIGRTGFICDATWSGGTEPATWNWSVTNGGITRTAILNGNPHTLYAAGICNIYTTFVVRLTVTDAASASATATSQRYCQGGNPA
ncbi:hypothetical protein [Actinomadura rubrisoli]|uniref:Ig-like domain-containing protein n=1 Tax=Actinomadura rubrisoli TaxID=2530368 RepID=A0A4R5B6T6_9ACTN|nr:hypothetical protein [Actinomadura rubrisoli]TDD81055.1 hypothetical protein E1298_24775 [Actinomadura rubrisoli]